MEIVFNSRRVYAIVTRILVYSILAVSVAVVVMVRFYALPIQTRKSTLASNRPSVEASQTLARDVPAVVNGSATLIDLNRYYRTPASRFSKIVQFPSWGTVPHGIHVYHNVPLQIEGFINIWGPHHTKTPECVNGVVLNQQFETLYVYHGTWYQSASGTPVYDIVFHYEDESVETVNVLYGDDVLDWFCDNAGGKVRGPTGKRSRLAWHGEPDPTGRAWPVRFCLSAIENPQPSVRVTTLDFVTRKSESTTCVLALTAGKSGLMR